MKLQFFIWAILGVALLITETGTAQVSEKDAQRALRGLTSIYLLVDDIDEEAKSCGITKSLIRDAFMFPASLSKIKISNDPVLTSSEFYVRVSSVIQQNPTQCVFALEFRVLNYQRVKLNYTSNDSWVYVLLWETTWLAVSGKAPGDPRNQQQVRDMVERATKKFLATWNVANQ